MTQLNSIALANLTEFKIIPYGRGKLLQESEDDYDSL